MSSDLSAVDVDFLTLEGYLKVLAFANRLELLATLRRPRALEEIQLTPTQAQAGESPDRVITRPAVQNHLDRLLEARIIRVQKTKRLGGRPVNEYVLDHAQLFGIIEEFRKLGRLQPVTPADAFATQVLASGRANAWAPGPKLVLVHGVEEGRVFPLRPSQMRAGRGFIIGRSPEAAAPLAFDPYVSAENAEIIPGKDGYRILDLRTSKNGTYLNWERLAVGGDAAIESGDVIGIGRSLLVFRPK